MQVRGKRQSAVVARASINAAEHARQRSLGSKRDVGVGGRSLFGAGHGGGADVGLDDEERRVRILVSLRVLARNVYVARGRRAVIGLVRPAAEGRDVDGVGEAVLCVRDYDHRIQVLFYELSDVLLLLR